MLYEVITVVGDHGGMALVTGEAVAPARHVLRMCRGERAATAVSVAVAGGAAEDRRPVPGVPAGA